MKQGEGFPSLNARLGRFVHVWAACGLLVCLAALSPASGQGVAPPPAVSGGFTRPTAGLCEDYPDNVRTQAKLDRDFWCLRETGARVLRVGISWQDIEPERGRDDWVFWDRLVDTAVTHHVTLIPYVCYTPQWEATRPEHFWTQPPGDVGEFRRFMALIAARYRGKIHSWELWNEPDNQDFWTGSVDQYAALVHAGAEGVRQGDPHATVVLGGMSNGWGDFLQTLIGQYHIASVVDVVNLHGYFETWNSHPLDDYPAYIAHVAALVRDAPRPPALWLAEFGYSSVPPAGGVETASWSGGAGAHTPAGQAVALFKSHVLARSTGRLALTAWYRINDLPEGTGVIGDSLNWSLGVLDVKGNPKPAFFALRFYNRLFGPPTRSVDSSVRVTPRASGVAPVVHAFARADGSLILVGWLRGVSPIGPGEEISLSLPHRTRPRVETFDALGHALPSRAVWAGDRLRHVVLTRSGLFIVRLTPPKTNTKENLCTRHSTRTPSASMPPA